MAIRLIDAGTVSHVRSQALYHGLAYARTEATPATIVLVTPGEPYVCIGFHQDVEREVDLAFCRERGLPVLRRETGGGAVYLDRDQLFVQWVMGPDSLPLRTDRRFALFAQPLIATYRELGVEAELRPPNDVHVAGRKIVGTGAARIGGAEVLVGNFIFDFDTAVMARVVRAPSSAFREQVDRSLRLYMTSLRRELGSAPDREQVTAIYRQQCAEVLGEEPTAGALTAAEVDAIEAMERKLGSEEFTHRAGGLRRPGLKIHEDVYVVATQRPVAGGGSIEVTARMRAGRIEDVALRTGGSGPDAVADLERALIGVELLPDPVARAVGKHGPSDHEAGPGPADWVEAILALKTNPNGHDS